MLKPPKAMEIIVVEKYCSLSANMDDSEKLRLYSPIMLQQVFGWNLELPG